MRLKKKFIFLILIVMVLASTLLLIKDGIKKKVVIYDVAVIIRGKNIEDWGIIKAGMEQASLERNINLRFISLLEENNVEEQKKQIQKEFDSGTDAIIISPADYEELSTIIENVNKKIPVVLFESKINSKENIAYISSDNYSLGQKLAEEIIRNGNTRNKLIIAENNFNYSSINERYNGFLDEIKYSKNTYELISLPKDDSMLYSTIKNIIEEDEDAVLVSLETSSLEAIGKAKKYLMNSNINNNIEVYGIGRTSTIISLIEEKLINATIIQNDFNIGYLSIETAVDKLENTKLDSKINIEYTVINRENMYYKENQKILFPIVR